MSSADCTPERSDVGDLRLLDVSLVVIGRGAVAEALVQRRCAGGGRVCWLWTEELPAGPHSAWDTAEPGDARGQHASDAVGTAEPVGARCQRDLSDLVWRPRKPHTVPDPAFVKVQWEWGSTHRCWRTTGPDIVELGKGESYRVLCDAVSGAQQLQVFSGRHPDSVPLWEISGVVILAGHFPSSSTLGMLCETEQDVDKWDLRVHCEEAKPFVTVRPSHAALWGVLCFLHFVVFLILMGAYETQVESGDGKFAWWRISFFITSWPAMMALHWDIMGPLITGSLSTGFSSAFLVTCLTAWIQCFFGTAATWSLFLTQSLALSIHIPTSLVVHFVNYWTSATRQQIGWFRHMMWCFWFFNVNAGTWGCFYSASQMYVTIRRQSILAGILLPILTATLEFFSISACVRFYNCFVYLPRAQCTESETPCTAIRGDQKQALTVPLCLVHSFAESTRLVSIFATVVKEPSWEWFPELLLCFGSNLVLRTWNNTEVFSCVMPRCMWWMVAPGAGSLLHNEVRQCFGYPRFISLAALAVSNIVLHGAGQWPLWNMHATIFVAAAAIFEILEDFIVVSDVLTRTAWRKRTALRYRPIDPLSPKQAMTFSRDGLQPTGPALGFSSMRFASCRAVLYIMVQACTFAYHLLCLLLGAGFVHGACSSPLPEKWLLANGIWWPSPLPCSYGP